MQSHVSTATGQQFFDIFHTCVIWLKGMVVPSTLCTTSAATCMPAAGLVSGCALDAQVLSEARAPAIADVASMY
jgi:hypothetical protein